MNQILSQGQEASANGSVYRRPPSGGLHSSYRSDGSSPDEGTIMLSQSLGAYPSNKSFLQRYVNESQVCVRAPSWERGFAHRLAAFLFHP